MKVILGTIVALRIMSASSAQIPYGNNPAAGRYFSSGDAKIYYEVYGSGSPLVLLHGGIFGYITDFESLIPELSKKYRGCPAEQYLKLYRLLKKGHLTVIPISDHLVFLRQPKVTSDIIWSFLSLNH